MPFASILARPRHVRLGGNLGNAGCLVLPVEGIGLDMIQAPEPERVTVALRKLQTSGVERVT